MMRNYNLKFGLTDRLELTCILGAAGGNCYPRGLRKVISTRLPTRNTIRAGDQRAFQNHVFAEYTRTKPISKRVIANYLLRSSTLPSWAQQREQWHQWCGIVHQPSEYTNFQVYVAPNLHQLSGLQANLRSRKQQSNPH